jgi:hypothetical protein
MTVRSTPIFVEGNSHPGEETRLMLGGMLGAATGTFSGGAASSDPAHGVINSVDLAVTQNGTPNMSVNVAAGGAFIRGTQSANQGAYHLWNDATLNVAISASDPTNPRRDLIIAQVRDAYYSGSTRDARITVVTGTAAASPTDPSLAAFPNALVLARVAVAANATTIVTANITDLRPLANVAEKIPTFATTALRSQFIPVPSTGQTAYMSNDNTLYTYNGTSWVPSGSLVPHTVGRNNTNITTTGSSTVWANIPTTTTLSITKYRADTNLIVALSMSAQYVNTVADFINIGVLVNGVDYQIAANGTGANSRQAQAGSTLITGLAAGTYAVQLRYRVTGGGGGLVTWDSNTGYNLMLTETL